MANAQYINYGEFTAPYHRAEVSIRNNQNAAGTVTSQEYVLTVRGVLTAAAGETDLIGAVNRMQFELWKPRQHLSLIWQEPGGPLKTLYRFGPPIPVEGQEASDQELGWGPATESLDFGNIAGGLACDYTWRVKATTRTELNDAGGKSTSLSLNPIYSLERTFDFRVDADGLTTRTIAGEFRLWSDKVYENGQGPDAYRYVVEPPLPDGFRREEASFTVQADGLTATFRFTDREVPGYNLPNPMTGGDATLSSITEGLGGRVRFTLSGWFSAAKTTTRAQIVQCIYDLAADKIPQAVQQGQGGFVESREIASDVYGNRFRFSFRWWQMGITGLGVAFPRSVEQALIAAPKNSTGKATQVGVYGSAGLVSYIPQTPYDPSRTQLNQINGSLSQKGPTSKATARSEAPSPKTGSSPAAPADGRSDVAKKVFIFEALHQRSYEIKTPTKVWPSKVVGQPAFVQRTGLPYMVVIDAGCFRWASKTAADGPKLPDPPTGNVVESFVSPVSSEPLGDGTVNMYKVTWRHVVVDPRTLETGTKAFAGLRIAIPADIRRSDSKDEILTKGPDAIVPDIKK